MHDQLPSLQRLKTCRLPKPTDQAPLRGCQHFCLWTGYHLAPRAIPRTRVPRSQSPAELLICRPSISLLECGGFREGLESQERNNQEWGNNNFYSFIDKNYNAPSQLSKLQ